MPQRILKLGIQSRKYRGPCLFVVTEAVQNMRVPWCVQSNKRGGNSKNEWIYTLETYHSMSGIEQGLKITYYYYWLSNYWRKLSVVTHHDQSMYKLSMNHILQSVLYISYNQSILIADHEACTWMYLNNCDFILIISIRNQDMLYLDVVI